MKYAVFSFVCCVSVLFLVDETNAQISVRSNSQHPDHPGLCYFDDGENKFFLKPGHRRKHPILCYEVKCDDDFSLLTIGCGPRPAYNWEAPDSIQCRPIAGDQSKPYPRCCGDWAC